MADIPEKPLTRHGQWRSTFAFVMATTGAAVGLGNIWKFPHMAGDHGGSAFVIVYMAFVVLIGIPIMMAEVLIGKMGRMNPVDSYKSLALANQRTPLWGILGWIGALALLCVLSFYSVVAGWSVGYFVMALRGVFNHATPQEISDIWGGFVSSPASLFLWHTVFMVMTLAVVARGVERGIETASKIMMPMLFLILIVLVGYALKYGDVTQAVHFLFDFKFHELTPTIVIAALGHAFFTLALGAGALLVYGAYVPEKTSLAKTLSIVALLDVGVALLSGLAIFPIVFQHNLPAADGFGLMYKILPITFSTLPAGQWIGAMFFLLLVFAAWTSTFSMAEPLVMLLVEKTKLTRHKASFYVGLVCWIIGIGALLSFNVWDTPLIKDWNFFTILTLLPTNVLLPLGGIGIALFAGWVLSKSSTQEALNLHPNKLFNTWHFIVRYLGPIAVGVVLIAPFLFDM